MSEETGQVQEGAGAPQASPGMMSVLNALGGSNPAIEAHISEQAASAAAQTGQQQQHITTDSGMTVAVDQIDGSGTVQDPAAGNENNASGNEAATATGTEASGTEAVKTKAAETEDDFFIESPLFGGKKKLSNPETGTETPATDLKTVEGIASVFKEKLGVESLDKIPETLEGFAKLREEHTQFSTEMQNVKTLFEQMPTELYQAIDLFAKGQDWKSTLSGSGIDYNKPVDSYLPKDLVNAMMPGKITEAQWEEFQQEDCDPNVKSLVTFAIDSAKDKFTGQSEQIKKASEQMVQKSAQQQAAFQSSIEASKAVFSEKWKDAPESYLKEIETDFKTGKIMQIFYNEDGTLRADAYVRAAMARDGENLVEQSLKKLENMKQTLVNKEILKTTSNTPSGGTGASGGSRQDLRPELQTRLEQIKQIAPKTEKRY